MEAHFRLIEWMREAVKTIFSRDSKTPWIPESVSDAGSHRGGGGNFYISAESASPSRRKSELNPEPI
ncbi:MAG: hypothetical protein ABI464_10745 [Chthoniobacteraceae bacterium]